MDIPHSVSFDDITYSRNRQGQESGLRRHTRNGLREIIVLTVIRTSHIIAIRDAALEEPKPFIKSVIIKSYPFWEDRVGLIAFFELLADARGLETLEFDCRMDKSVASQIALYLEQGKLKDLHHLNFGPRLEPFDTVKEFSRKVVPFTQINHVTLTPNTDESSNIYYKVMFNKCTNVTHVTLNAAYGRDENIRFVAQQMKHVKELEIVSPDYVARDDYTIQRPSSIFGFLYTYPDVIKNWISLEILTWKIDVWMRRPTCEGLAPIFEKLSLLPRFRSFKFVFSGKISEIALNETCINALNDWIAHSETLESLYFAGVKTPSSPLFVKLVDTATKSRSMKKLTLPVPNGIHYADEAFEYIKHMNRRFKLTLTDRFGHEMNADNYSDKAYLKKLEHDARLYQMDTRIAARMLASKIREEDSRVYQSTGLPEDVVRNKIMGEFLGIKL